jgi:hypothetical protein
MVDTLGYDSLVAKLIGIENPAEPDEDVAYTGTLRRVTRIDYCITRPQPDSRPSRVVQGQAHRGRLDGGPAHGVWR